MSQLCYRNQLSVGSGAEYWTAFIEFAYCVFEAESFGASMLIQNPTF